jgi:5-methylcytosine-specific restriction endonuclease McrA
MNVLRQRQPRLRLDREKYEALRRRVLERDGWRCQRCGSRTELQVHHLKLRSQLGHDALENLITLCAGCHRHQHLRSGIKSMRYAFFRSFS